MSIVTATEIINTVSIHGISAGQILAADIEAAQWNRIRTALGADAYDTIIDDAGSEYSTVYAYLQKALSYFVITDILPRINTEVSDRGLFALQAENASKAQQPAVDDVKESYLKQGNAYMSMAIDWLIDNEFTDYTANMTETALDYSQPMYAGNVKRDTRL